MQGEIPRKVQSRIEKGQIVNRQAANRHTCPLPPISAAGRFSGRAAALGSAGFGGLCRSLCGLLFGTFSAA